MPVSAPPSLHTRTALRIQGSERVLFEDTVIDESAIALVYNGITQAVMMATPADLEDFGLGYSLTEGIIASAAEWRFIEAHRHDGGIGIEMHIPQQCFDAAQARRRQLIGNSACGLCGSESLQAALRPLAASIAPGPAISAERILQALRALAAAQPLNRSSGGVHAAGYAHDGGLLVREDVGRHNALDKVIGARARAGLGPGFAVMTSRASYELVHKTASAGIPLLATVSAPTSAAIELAQSSGLTLIAFARGEQMNVYCHEERVATNA
jgi:formate dehydrogenase accessory protein FdhD